MFMRISGLTCLAALLLVGATARGADEPKQAEPAGAAGVPLPSTSDLASRQAKLGDRFQKFEEILLRLAELTAKSDPERAALMRKAVQQSKRELIALHFERASELLKSNKLGDSLATQGTLKQDLLELLELLLNAHKDVQSDLRDRLKKLDDVIKKQKEIQDQTRRGGDPRGQAGPQGNLAKKTGDLARPGQPAQGQPGQGQATPGNAPPGNAPPGPPNPDASNTPRDEPPAKQRIEEAEQKMKDAQRELEQARRENAVDRQEEALDKLRSARAELVEILRQAREEEVERVLALLEARFRKMLEMQVTVYEGTLLLDRTPAAERGRSHEVEAGRLSQRESQIVAECNKALQLLKEDGTSTAVPEAVVQIRDDMQMVAIRLQQSKVDTITQGVEEDLIAALEEMIAALQKAQREQEHQPKPEPPPRDFEPKPEDQPLVDVLAELKMVRSLQLRVNARTQKFSRLVDGEVAQKAELLEALKELAGREARIFKVTRDLSLERNK